MSVATEALDRWLFRIRHDEIRDAIDDIEGAVTELTELANGDKYPGEPGHLATEINRESSRAFTAISVLNRHHPDTDRDQEYRPMSETTHDTDNAASGVTASNDDFTCCTGLHLALGIDPGPVTGIAMIAHNNGTWTTLAAQCSHALTRSMLSRFIDDTCVFGVPVHVEIEDFVASKRASRSATASAGQIARDLVAQIEADAAGWPQLVHLHKRNAGNVKPWATDERLEAAGAIEAAKGMRHARDAARHALYTLCRDGNAHDPLGHGNNGEQGGAS